MKKRTIEPLEYFEDRFVDETQMSDAELDDYIKTLRHTALHYKTRWVHDDPTLLATLRIATDEKNNRSAAKQVEASNNLARETLNLTKKTIYLWRIAIGVGVFAAVFSGVGVIIGIMGIWG